MSASKKLQGSIQVERGRQLWAVPAALVHPTKRTYCGASDDREDPTMTDAAKRANGRFRQTRASAQEGHLLPDFSANKLAILRVGRSFCCLAQLHSTRGLHRISRQRSQTAPWKELPKPNRFERALRSGLKWRVRSRGSGPEQSQCSARSDTLLSGCDLRGASEHNRCRRRTSSQNRSG